MAVALLTIAGTLGGCGAVGKTEITALPMQGVSETTELSYSYSDTQKTFISENGVFEDFEKYRLGESYTADTNSQVKLDVLSLRPKLSTFQIADGGEEHGNVFAYKRDNASANAGSDAHMDVEIASAIPAGVDFVVEADVKLGGQYALSASVFQVIYRPSEGNIFGNQLKLDANGRLKADDQVIGMLGNDEFVRVSIVVHQTTSKADIYVDGQIVYTGFAYTNKTVATYTPMQIRLITSSSGTGSVLFDNIAVYKGSKPLARSLETNSFEMLVSDTFDGVGENEYNGNGAGITVNKNGLAVNGAVLPDGRDVIKFSASADEEGSVLVSSNKLGDEWSFSTELYPLSDSGCLEILLNGGESLLKLSGRKLTDTQTGKTVYTVGKGKWLSLAVHVDKNSGAYDVCIDGYMYISSRKLALGADGCTGIKLAASKGNGELGLLIDDLKLYNSNGIIGYKGECLEAIESVTEILGYGSYGGVTGNDGGIEITDEIKGSGAGTLKLNGLNGNIDISLANSELDTIDGYADLSGYDAIRLRFYAPQNSARTVMLLIESGIAYTDGKNYYYGNDWGKNGSGKYTSASHPNVYADIVEGNGWSYYSYRLCFDGDGWCTVTIPLSAFGISRAPSWSHIEKMSITVTGWNLESSNVNALLPAENSVCYIDVLELISYK